MVEGEASAVEDACSVVDAGTGVVGLGVVAAVVWASVAEGKGVDAGCVGGGVLAGEAEAGAPTVKPAIYQLALGSAASRQCCPCWDSPGQKPDRRASRTVPTGWPQPEAQSRTP